VDDQKSQGEGRAEASGVGEETGILGEPLWKRFTSLAKGLAYKKEIAKTHVLNGPSEKRSRSWLGGKAPRRFREKAGCGAVGGGSRPF